jgi:hypothetical protein
VSTGGSGRRVGRLMIWTCRIVSPPLSRHSCRMADDTDAYIAITRLQASYADVVTRRAWTELDPLFTPDAALCIDPVTKPAVDVVGAHGFAEFVAPAVDRFEFFEFVILNTVIDVHDHERATGRLYMVEVRQERDSREWSNAFGLYQDDYVVYDGRWRFAARRYRSMARRIGTDPASVFT